MQLLPLRFTSVTLRQFWRQWRNLCLYTLIAGLTSLLLLGTPPALASIDDDRYEGNIFALYAGNGYIDDSSDSKQYSRVVSQLQQYYGRVADFIPVSVDKLPVKSSHTPKEPGYYYEGVVPQTILIDQKGEVVFNGKGQVAFEDVDDKFREVFDLLPRSESVKLKRRATQSDQSTRSDQ
ncbi:MAG: thioredoxin family protein [Cyanobacteria bacterium QH_7_48_89]|nr:MAG: thioredoxin family protein [Cyanobacteria bacterium QH_7_48_89]